MITRYNPKVDSKLKQKHLLSRLKTKRLSWHEYFISQAIIVSERSLDSQSKYGCIIVDNKKRIIATGYNSFVRGIDDGVLSNTRPLKYDFMIHAEHNAILSLASSHNSAENCSAYVTGPSCLSCLQYMYQAGINKIYYPNTNIAKMMQDEEYNKKRDLIIDLMSDHLEINIVEFSQ